MTFVEYSEWHLLWLKASYSCRCQTTTLLAIHYVGRLFLRVPLEFGHLEVTIGWNDLIITAESCSSLRVFQSTGSFNSASRKNPNANIESTRRSFAPHNTAELPIRRPNS
ncbi:predicted protein [Arabidopsis lyrata subsp. lyrata]|uniref:Predicted protein n=1 Tax=Arabidopsis lyrata subsp. lyrata TaxID=81972 RepID=D7KTD2_ARALL|nr:predicted protein [Arabidopsis lyrata subsp. lyrata]